jgi:hypothetical protein
MTTETHDKMDLPRRPLSLGVYLLGLLLIYGAYCAMTSGGPSHSGSSQSGPSRAVAAAPQTESEKVERAITDQYACTPASRNVHYTGSDKTGTVYLVGCDRWIYSVFIDPQGQVRASRITAWNGIN